MLNISDWINLFLPAINKNFGERVWFVGLQGSYGRGEATETSDIDIVVILDNLTPADIRVYNNMLNTLPYRELVCGFISGRKELLNWEPSDLFQFYYDTKPIIGVLDELIDLLDDSALSRAIKTSACNIYHTCVHNMLHEKSEEILKGLYKSASFVIQAISFKETGKYISSLSELIKTTSSTEKSIIEIFLRLKRGGVVIFEEMSDIIFNWSKMWIDKA